MAATLTTWFPELSLYVPGLTYPSAEKACRLACRKFAEQTWLYFEDLTAIDVVEDTYSYTLTDPSNTEIVAIDDVKFKEDGADDDQFVSLDPISEVLANQYIGGGWKYYDSNTPTEYWGDVVNKKLWLKPPPDDDSTGGLLVTVVIKPDLTCTTVSDFFYNDYYETIIEGAMEILFAQSAMPWFNMALSKEHGINFRNMINDAKWKRMTGITNRPARVVTGGFSKGNRVKGRKREDYF